MTRRTQILTGIALSLGAALLLSWFGPGPKAPLEERLWSEAAWWGALAVVLLHVRAVEKQPFASIGLRPMNGRETLMALAGAVALMLVVTVITLGLFPLLLLSISMSHVSNLLHMPWWYRAIMVLRMAVAGELLFRSTPIERAAALGPAGKWIGAGLSLAAFVAATWSGWEPVESVAAVFTGLVATALYLWRRNAGVNMLARAIALGAGYLVH